MAESWFFIHEGKTYGPAPTAALGQLAAGGKLAPNDLVWPAGGSPLSGVPAHNLIPFTQAAAPRPAVPEWLGDVRAAQPPPSGQAPAKPDWLDDVRQAEAGATAGVVAGPVVEAKAVPPPLPTAAAPPPPIIPVVEVTAVPIPVRGTPVPPGAGPPLVMPASQPLSAPALGQGRLAVGGATSKGMVRERNEDSFLVLQASWANLDVCHETVIVVVADGMGGHQAGDRASGLVVRAMARALAPLLAEAVAGSAAAGADAVPTAIDRAFGEAQRAVTETSRADPACKDMGSTAVAVVVRDDDAFIGLVGDCRVYHHRGDRLTQLTRDQTLVNRMVDLGQLTEAEAATHPRRNEITQAVGQRGALQPARYQVKLAPGDWLIISCDGLYAHVDEQTLREAVGPWAASAALLAEHLVDLANQLGGSDNCTVLTVCRG